MFPILGKRSLDDTSALFESQQPQSHRHQKHTYTRRAQHRYFLTNKKAGMYLNIVQCKSVQPCVSHKEMVEMVLCVMLPLCRAPVCMCVERNRKKKLHRTCSIKEKRAWLSKSLLNSPLRKRSQSLTEQRSTT